MSYSYVYLVQILFVAGIAIGSQILNFQDIENWLHIVRYAIYILTVRAVASLSQLVQQAYSSKNPSGLLEAAREARGSALIFLLSAATLLHFGEKLFQKEFVFVALASLLLKYPEMAGNKSISYGVGMACSYFEGYLTHIIPSDGANFVGFEENIQALSNRHGVLFPVRKLFIVITKDLYSPPDLKQFNRGTQLPHLEMFDTTPDVVRNVAGVHNRTYRNTAYKIYRGGAPPVCLAAECATPLHTLHKVLNNRAVYQELTDINVDAVVTDFCTTLRSIMDKSPPCRGKCELVYYDHADPSQNLAEILLARIRELEPDFENQILARRDHNVMQQ